MIRNRADCVAVSRWKRMANGNMRSRYRFFHTCAGCRGFGMVERRGTNGGSTGVGLNMVLDGELRSMLNYRL